MKKYTKIIFLITALILIVIIFLSFISKSDNDYLINNLESQPARELKIPLSAIKQTPETDKNPPVSLSPEYENPAPLSPIINTAGAEDSPFITSDGNTLYFFFTPDVNIPAEKQLLDGITGIYVSHKIGGEWSPPQRIFLTEKRKLALDGCEFVDGNVMLFCSAREGYMGVNWFSAEFKNGEWVPSKNKINFPEEYQVGELHKYNDELYFHSFKSGGKGGLDIWMMKKNSDGEWTTPENLEAINTIGDEGWPAISKDGNELWFSKDYAVWRSKKINGKWATPEKIFSPLAGEPSVDVFGDVYFVHHFYQNNQMIEADIYFSKKK